MWAGSYVYTPSLTYVHAEKAGHDLLEPATVTNKINGWGRIILSQRQSSVHLSVDYTVVYICESRALINLLLIIIIDNHDAAVGFSGRFSWSLLFECGICGEKR